jgi:hypothetical protein
VPTIVKPEASCSAIDAVLVVKIREVSLYSPAATLAPAKASNNA